MPTSSKFRDAAKLERFRGGVLVQQEVGAVEWEAWVPCSARGISIGEETDLLLQGRWYKLLCQGVRENGKLGEWEIPALRHVVRKPGVCGGRPVLDKSRTDVETIVRYWKLGTPDSEILENYEHMVPEDLWCIREWLKVPENAAEIDNAIEQEEEQTRRIRAERHENAFTSISRGIVVGSRVRAHANKWNIGTPYCFKEHNCSVGTVTDIDLHDPENPIEDHGCITVLLDCGDEEHFVDYTDFDILTLEKE